MNSKGGVELFWISQKEKLFSSLVTTALLGLISRCRPPPSCILQKMAFLSPLVWARREYSWTLIWKKNWLIFFENYQGVSYSHRQSRKRMMSTFIMINITPIYKSSLESIFMLFMQGKKRNLVCIFSKQRIFWY